MKCLFVSNSRGCGTECGSAFVCEEHRRFGTDHTHGRMWAIVRDIVLALAATPWDTYICYHCGDEFPREAICVDHFPKGRRGRHCIEMWDLLNLVPSCKACNTSGNANRAGSIRRKTLRPMQQHYVDRRAALISGLQDLYQTRDRLSGRGHKMPPLHEHVLLIARALSLRGIQ